MKVLVTGATGFLGRNIVDRLRADGATVRALVRPGHRRSVEVDEICEGDLREHDSLARAVGGMDCVLHAGARVSTVGTWEEFEATNVRATDELIRLALEAGVQRFVHVSSLSVYAVPAPGAVIDEDGSFETGAAERGLYARSKLAADRLALQWAARGAPVTVARPGLLYGPGRRPPLGRRVVALGPLRVILASPSYLLPLAYVENVAAGLILAAHENRTAVCVYNLVDHQVRQRDYVRLYRRVSGERFAAVQVPAGFIIWLASVADRLGKGLGVRLPISRHQVERTVWSAEFTSQRALQILGWSPTITLEEGLRRAFSSLREASRPASSLGDSTA